MKLQKESVFDAVQTVLEEKGISYKEGMDISEAIKPNSDERKQVIALIVADFKAGNVGLKTEYDTDKKLTSYVNGLVSNWFRKDIRINGGAKHAIQNPGSRAGVSNEVIKNLRKMLKAVEGNTESTTKVQTVLDAEIVKHKATNQKKIEVNLELIPEELRCLLG